MSDIITIKEQFGNLGLYLIKKAEEEIKKINENSLNQKSIIKKTFILVLI